MAVPESLLSSERRSCRVADRVVAMADMVAMLC